MSNYGYYYPNNHQEMNPRPQRYQQQRGSGGHNRRRVSEDPQHHGYGHHQQMDPSQSRSQYKQQHRYFNSSGNGNNSFNRRKGFNPNFTGPQQQQKRKVDDVTISKGLAFILRHGALNMKLNMNKEGFVCVNDILKLPKYRHVTHDDIKSIVQNNNKQRFHLKNDKHGNLMIGANQGHTIKVKNIDLKPITEAKSYPCVVHGTTYKAWDVIKGEGLKTMGRTHIHFASGEPGEEGVISGMRGSSQVLIFIDLEKALNGGINFALSRNGVILSEGDKNGTISPVFFVAAIDRHTRTSLLKKGKKRTFTESASSSDYTTTTVTSKKKKK